MSLKERVMKIIESVIVNQRKFDYSYYLSKHAPLPHEWVERKKQLLEMAEKDPKVRG
jgi:hypothetical protein